MKHLNYEKRRFRFRFSINKCTPLEKKEEGKQGRETFIMPR